MYLKADKDGLYIEVTDHGINAMCHVASRTGIGIRVSELSDADYKAVIQIGVGGSDTSIFLNEEQLEELKSKLDQI